MRADSQEITAADRDRPKTSPHAHREGFGPRCVDPRQWVYSRCGLAEIELQPTQVSQACWRRTVRRGTIVAGYAAHNGHICWSSGAAGAIPKQASAAAGR